MKLLREMVEEVNVIMEDAGNGKKNYYIEGVFLQGNTKNRNGRIYPTDILDEEVKRYTKEYINENRAFGELSHPATPQINLDRVSHIIKSLTREGNNFIGRAKVMDTPMGKIVKNFIDEGAKLGVSSRGLGTVDERSNCSYVRNDFRLATAADVVSDPSVESAFVNAVMENAEWLYVEGKGWIPQYLDQAKQTIIKAPSRKLEEVKLKLFEDFMKKL